MSKEEVKLLLLIILYNAIPMICFTTLAIVFDKWWIIFFTLLFYKTFNISYNSKNDKHE